MFVLSSCSKDAPLEQEVERTNTWTVDERFQYHFKSQLYATKIGNKLAMIGPYGYTNLKSDSSMSQGSEISRYALYFTPSINVKLPISERYFVGANMKDDKVLFVNSDYPVSTGLSFSLDMRTIDPTFQELLFVHSHFGESMAINDKNQTLMAYRSADENNYPIMKLLLVDVDAGDEEPSNFSWMKINNSKVIDLDRESHYGMDMITTTGDNFLVSSHSKTLHVSSDGVYKEVLDKALVRTFSDKDILYGFGRNGDFYQSSDRGNSWRKAYDVERLLSDVTFSHVGDQLVGYRYGQIWKFDFNESGYEAEELVNDGLVGNLITSLNEFDGKIYITTLSGVYHKPIEQFFEVKPNEEK
ncbi:hypothetical protein ACFSQ3_13295 [Sphingobacterium corticis]|uniref:BNR repeat-containing family member n=1 Tax=Sphingobacterium corticis TaxID=1812823 RepID=A0ABW5NNU3_9SPHI